MDGRLTMAAFPLHQLPLARGIDGVELPMPNHAPTRRHKLFDKADSKTVPNARKPGTRLKLRPGCVPERVLKAIAQHGPVQSGEIRAHLPDVAREQIIHALAHLLREHYIIRSGARRQYRYTAAQRAKVAA